MGLMDKKMLADDGDGADVEAGGDTESAQDLIDAIASGDAESVAMAFKAMMKAC